MTSSEIFPTHPSGLHTTHCRQKWGWIVRLGVLFIIGGVVALFNAPAATLVAIVYVAPHGRREWVGDRHRLSGQAMASRPAVGDRGGDQASRRHSGRAHSIPRGDILHRARRRAADLWRRVDALSRLSIERLGPVGADRRRRRPELHSRPADPRGMAVLGALRPRAISGREPALRWRELVCDGACGHAGGQTGNLKPHFAQNFHHGRSRPKFRPLESLPASNAFLLSSRVDWFVMRSRISSRRM